LLLAVRVESRVATWPSAEFASPAVVKGGFAGLVRSDRRTQLEPDLSRRRGVGSNVKVAAAGAVLDVPLGHKDDSWSFPHFDTITISVADAPRPDEILVVMALPMVDGFAIGAILSRFGKGPKPSGI
jgi:hypothetical protein